MTKNQGQCHATSRIDEIQATSSIDEIQAKISVEDFDYLQRLANSNKRINENDPRLIKIRAKLSEEDVDYLKGLANERFGVDSNVLGVDSKVRFGAKPNLFDNNVGTITLCVIL